jgi:hypothetical protein
MSVNKNKTRNSTCKNKQITRKAPVISATERLEGAIEWGNNGGKWVVVKTENGIHRWVPYYSASMFGYAPLTAKLLRKNINKPVTVYERSSQTAWPKSDRDFDVRYVFTASGDAELLKRKKGDCKLYTNWLQNKNSTAKANVKKHDVFIIKGVMESTDLGEGVSIQVAPVVGGELVSTNLMNTDAFVKI